MYRYIVALYINEPQVYIPKLKFIKLNVIFVNGYSEVVESTINHHRHCKQLASIGPEAHPFPSALGATERLQWPGSTKVSIEPVNFQYVCFFAHFFFQVPSWKSFWCFVTWEDDLEPSLVAPRLQHGDQCLWAPGPMACGWPGFSKDPKWVLGDERGHFQQPHQLLCSGGWQSVVRQSVMGLITWYYLGLLWVISFRCIFA